MLTRYCSFALITAMLAANPLTSAADEKNDLIVAKLIGTWKYDSGQKNGEKLDADHFSGQLIEITKETFTLKGNETFVMKYKLAAEKNPMSVDLTITESPFGTGATTVGILELKDDELKLCYAPRGGKVPTEFEARAGSEHHLFRLKRIEERLEVEKLVGSWKYSSGNKEGEKLGEEHFKGQSVVITEDTFTLKGEATFVMKYELDTKNKPASIKFTMTDSPFGAGATASGILQLKAGELSVCYAPRGGEAPSKFDATPGSGHFLFLLKRSEEK